MYMKSPITGKEMELRSKYAIIEYNGFDFEYWQDYYLCVDSGEEFTTTELDEINLERIKIKYELLRRS